MDEGSPRTEREWAADKRDFVADRRDQDAHARDDAADVRDAYADRRERDADERELALDGRERRLTARASEQGVPSDRSEAKAAAAAQKRKDAAGDRAAATERRRDERVGRAFASERLLDSSKRRHANTPPSGLALAFAEIARHLYQSQDMDAVLEAIARAAVATLVGCDMSSITARESTTFRTLASTDPSARDVDDAQYAADEGPCLDATTGIAVYAGEFPDPRWPKLASEPTRFGVHSVASFHIDSPERQGVDEFVGSLNAYSRERDGFDREAREIGVVLAAHASMGVSAVSDRVRLEQRATQLHDALQSRDVIGQATGILMERFRVTPEEAFDILRRASQNLNIKLRHIAESLTETGELRTSNR